MKLFNFLQEKILILDNEINFFLLEQRISHIQSKEVLLGEKSNLNFHSHIYTYGIRYTFFENIEDNFGSRPNDISLSIVIFIGKDDSVKIEQGIYFGSVLDDIILYDSNFIYPEIIDYDEVFNFNFIKQKLVEGITLFLKMKD